MSSIASLSGCISSSNPFPFEELPTELQSLVIRNTLKQARETQQSVGPYFLVSKKFSYISKDIYSQELMTSLLQIPSAEEMVKGIENKMERIEAIVTAVDPASKNVGDLLLHTQIRKVLSSEAGEQEFHHVESLLRGGCNPNVQSSHGHSPLSLVLCYLDQGKPELHERIEQLVALLLKFGANPNGTPLYQVVEQMPCSNEYRALQLKLLAYLCEKGALPGRKAMDHVKGRYPVAAEFLGNHLKKKPSLLQRILALNMLSRSRVKIS